MKKSVWSTILKVIIAVATTIVEAFGLRACQLFQQASPTRPHSLKKTTSPKEGTLYLEGQSSSRGRPLPKEPGATLYPALAGGHRARRPRWTTGASLSERGELGRDSERRPTNSPSASALNFWLLFSQEKSNTQTERRVKARQCYFYQNYREVRLLVVHCSTTHYDRDFPMETLRSAHKDRRFVDIDYHYYITRDGEPHRRRPKSQIGAHASGWNDHSLGVYYEGGLDEQDLPADTHTYAQCCTLLDLLWQLRRGYPSAHILEHCQLSPCIRKAYPCFDAEKEYAELC